ncbi:ThuA domain-containing protein [uncultured Algibacter sp.]|uniref:ThuA domain-containing protein n=1 Tax=uncultured Algibacter sp. TaxID=298659 RepID=UPI002619E874|nr:ThuA domain-containing protein [uncultured Algibacter sp.]
MYCTAFVAQTKIVVFSKTSSFRHKSIEVGVKSIKRLGEQNNILVHATENSNELIKNIHKYDAVVFLNTTGNIFNDEEKEQFKNYIEKGGGFVGIHSATDTEHNWSWYGNMVGAYFLKHPKKQNATIHVKNCKHPATSFLNKTWVKFDEWYNFKNINPNINVLLTLDETTYTGGLNGEFHPISWCQKVKKGKMFYTGLGHTIDSYSDDLFLKHILGGIQYVID